MRWKFHLYGDRRFLLQLGIDIKQCRGLTLDGTSSMQSEAVGVAGRLSKLVPSAIRTHCHMHCVNFAVQGVVKNVALMRDFLQIVQELVVFLKGSPKRYAIIQKIAQDLDCPQTHIRPLCPTRFSVKYHALLGLRQQAAVILEALKCYPAERN